MTPVTNPTTQSTKREIKRAERTRKLLPSALTDAELISNCKTLKGYVISSYVKIRSKFSLGGRDNQKPFSKLCGSRGWLMTENTIHDVRVNHSGAHDCKAGVPRRSAMQF
jgi:hypothetical protein